MESLHQAPKPQSAGEGAYKAGRGELPRRHAEDLGRRGVFRVPDFGDSRGHEKSGAEEHEPGDAEVGAGVGALGFRAARGRRRRDGRIRRGAHVSEFWKNSMISPAGPSQKNSR